jgi:hypothetical protein
MLRKLFTLEDQDARALRTIQKRYGCESQSQAVRLALRWLAQADVASIKLARVEKRRKTKKHVVDLRGRWKLAFKNAKAANINLDEDLREIRNAWMSELDAIVIEANEIRRSASATAHAKP